MKITLTDVRYAAFSSQETHCFSATIVIDGKNAGTARNDGNGGATWFEPRSMQAAIDAYARTLEPVDVSDLGGVGTIENNAEILVGELVNDWLLTRDMVRKMRKKVLFTKADGPAIYEVKPASLANLLARLSALLPQADKVLNVLPLDEALALYKANTR